ncbi:MAG: ATP phosphoribosyltransferase regulatory subunit [Fusobacteriales bacterium]|nr:ATP phosphoribosyltransferase regulatory subunit [Fusobacteriales bacterium]
MKKFISSLKEEEKIILKLRKHYEQYGYKKIKLSKFESYGLYNENADFIKIENIITFMAPTGKLQTLRPDVTLSIVKKYAGDKKKEMEKLYYIENIYRLSKEDMEYKELNQIGVEILGESDGYSDFEIINLAAESLELINKNFILDISNINYLSGLFEEMNLGYTLEKEVLMNIQHKNVHDLEKILTRENVESKYKEILIKIPDLSGKFDSVITEAEKLVLNKKMQKALDELKILGQAFPKMIKNGKILLDFSIVNSLDYYNGLIFHGYIENNPKIILSGGNYDKLIEKYGKNKGATGFAIYLDELSGKYKIEKEYDFDILILYKNGDNAKLLNIAKKYIEQGFTIRTEKYREDFNTNFKYKEKYVFEDDRLVGKE